MSSVITRAPKRTAFFCQAEDGLRDVAVTGVQTCALPISLARITAYASGGGEPKDLFFAPIVAVQTLMAKAKTTIDDYELIEANEAFAVQALADGRARSEEHTSELQSRLHLVCRLLLEKKK